ncbi:MAG: glycosyltransferase family A protein [Rothia sp. (in: high G+C Gram-positive bacteria)]|nr:glycosyltransferase family A protein [Rothia sp. (in: high G+C Gram-positive bacteria)]
MPVKTSIIIPCHNAALTLDLQLESIHCQEGAEPFEVLVVLNNCTDNSAQLVENWRDRLDIQAIEANELAGASYARNVGARHARGSQLIFCDADDALSAHYVAHAQRALSEKELFCGGYPAVPEKYFNGPYFPAGALELLKI